MKPISITPRVTEAPYMQHGSHKGADMRGEEDEHV